MYLPLRICSNPQSRRCSTLHLHLFTQVFSAQLMPGSTVCAEALHLHPHLQWLVYNSSTQALRLGNMHQGANSVHADGTGLWARLACILICGSLFSRRGRRGCSARLC